MREVISFDVDGTLAKRDLLDRFWFEEVPRLYSEYNGDNFEDARDFVMGKYEDMGPGDIRWYQPDYWFDRWGFEENPLEILWSISDEVEIYRDARPSLEKLYGERDLMIISNASEEFLEVQLKGLKDYFSVIYSCVSDFGMTKKNERVYGMICESAGIDMGNLIHVGDGKEFDYEIPKKVGIKAYFLDRSRDHTSSENNVIHDLREAAKNILSL